MSDDIFKDIGDILQEEANEKIKEGMQEFIRASDFVKSVFLHASGFTGELSAENLRDHFDTLELMDSIDGHIEDFKENREHGADE